MLRRIAHTTDFSRDSAYAFHHALAIAIAARCHLDILHVRNPGQSEAWRDFPRVREVLIRWGLLAADSAPSDIEMRLGVPVSKVEIGHHDPLGGLADFFRQHRPDLIVVATHGREGVDRWLRGSVTEGLVDRTRLPALMIGPDSAGIIDDATGALEIGRILMPVTSEPDPAVALHAMVALLAPLGVTASQFDLLNVGGDLPDIMSPAGTPMRVERREGSVVDVILREADDRAADLIAMPTTGRHGLLEAFRGSTTSRVLAHASCPVLTVPLPR